METFRIAAVQMNALKGDLDHNLDVHRRFTAQAAEAGCRVVLFPELGVTAHFGDPAVLEFAEPTAGGPVFSEMCRLAKQHDIIISYGFCEQAHGTFYNAQSLVGPEGFIGIQRKVHASWDEYYCFRMGRTLDVFDLGFCRVGTLVCFDSEFFEVWRVLALKGADVLLLPHAGRSGRGKEIPPDEILNGLKARDASVPGKKGAYAKDNAVFAVQCNQVGYNGHSTHSGGAYVVGPDGELVVKAEPSLDDLMITAELDAAVLTGARRKNAIMRQRRPEMYGELTEDV
jgi:N-carbamoylputrescine amidase